MATITKNGPSVFGLDINECWHRAYWGAEPDAIPVGSSLVVTNPLDCTVGFTYNKKYLRVSHAQFYELITDAIRDEVPRETYVIALLVEFIRRAHEE